MASRIKPIAGLELFVRVVPLHSGRSALAVCDSEGRLLPGQTGAYHHATIDNSATTSVTFRGLPIWPNDVPDA